jgi:hypothetical protein
METFAVIGLGRFGMTLARAIAKAGKEVIAIDSERAQVEEAQNDVAVVVRLDATGGGSIGEAAATDPAAEGRDVRLDADLAALFDYHLSPTVTELHFAELLGQEAARRKQQFVAHAFFPVGRRQFKAVLDVLRDLRERAVNIPGKLNPWKFLENPRSVLGGFDQHLNEASLIVGRPQRVIYFLADHLGLHRVRGDKHYHRLRLLNRSAHSQGPVIPRETRFRRILRS